MLIKIKYTEIQIEEIIDSHIEMDRNFLLVCDFALAHYVYDYIHNEYDLEAQELELSSEVNEYYISMSFYENGDITFICEFAKWDQEGKYKYDESDNQDYYVFTEMSFSDARDFLNSNGIMKFCELVEDNSTIEEDDNVEGVIPCGCDWCCAQRELEQQELEEQKDRESDVCDECKDCVGCDEHCGRGNHDEEYIDESEEELCFCEECNIEREQGLIRECLDMVFDPDACVDCTIDKVIETMYKFKELGYLEAREEMRDFLED